MAPLLDNHQLRNASPPDQAQILQKAAREASWKPVSEHLLDAVAAGSLPPNVFHVWLSVCKDTQAVVFALRQDTSVLVRHVAIARFEKALRTDDGFSAAWDAIGAIPGVMDLMASMSVHEVTSFCRALGRTATVPAAAPARQAVMSQLFEALDGRGSTPNPDERPLMDCYESLLLVCKPETAMEWHGRHDRMPRLDSKTCTVHRTACQENALQRLFAPATEDERQTCERYQALFDQDRTFALEVLERLAQDEKALDYNQNVWLDVLAMPLLGRNRRAQRSDANSRVEKVLALVLQCIQQKPSLASGINWLHGGFVACATKAWVRARDGRADIEKLLAQVLRLTSAIDYGSLVDITQLVEGAPPGLRFRLFKFLLLNAPGHRLDVDAAEPDLDAWSSSNLVKWPRSLFQTVLPPNAALKLFKLIQKANPGGEFIDMGIGYSDSTTILQSRKPDSTERSSDPDVLEAYLRYRVALKMGSGADKSRLEYASALIDERKKQSAACRERRDRAQWAKSAMKLSFASGSLHLVQKTFLWLQRFNREAETVTDMYSKYTLAVPEVLDLLAGIAPAESAAEYETLDWTLQSVKKANEIIMVLLETMAMTLWEPVSWHSYPWAILQHVLARAVERRFQNAEKYQERTGCSDEDMMTAVWQPTIDMLLETERFALKKTNKRLGMDGGAPLLRDWSCPLKNLRSSTQMALDRLAQGRDEIWQQHRIARAPATTTLEGPWPKGLPVQRLCAIDLVPAESPLLYMPYLASRAKDVVFLDAAALTPIPESEETREAIGRYVNSYHYALKIYLGGAKDDEERGVRLRSAWEHAITQLTGDRMSEDEASLFWRPHFLAQDYVQPGLATSEELEEAGIAKVPSAELPEFSSEDGDGPNEWNPCDSHRSMRQKTRALAATCLDVMLDSGINEDHWSRLDWPDPPVDFQVPEPFVPEIQMPDLWQLGRDPRHLSASQRDAMAATAIECVNSTYGSDVSIFGKPFPHPQDARYPAFYLDQDFLEQAGKYGKSPGALDLILNTRYCVPVQILVYLARALMTRLAKEAEERDPEIVETLMKVIKQLVHSDQPAVARTFVQKVVLEQQDDSSWHRQLFSAAFFRRLPAQQANGFFGDFSSQIQEMVRRPAPEGKPKPQQTETQTVTQEELPTEEANKKPVVKVTIVKMLAQVLRNANYCEPVRACKVLIGLFQGSPNLDIRVAAVESLVNMLGTENAEVHEMVIAFAQKDLVRVAGSLDERRPTTEKQWREAESGEGALPEIYEPHNRACAPLMSAIVAAHGRFSEKSAERQSWIETVTIPAVNMSATNHRRFCALFARRNGFAIPDDLLPAIPVKPEALLQHFTSAEPAFLTGRFFDAVKGYAMVQLCPHAALVAANEAVRGDARLQKSNGGKHWLRVWDWKHAPTTPMRLPPGFEQIIRFLNAELPEVASSNGMTVEAVQAFAKSTFEILLDQSRLGDLNYLWFDMGLFQHAHEVYRSRALPLFQSFIARIEALRTPQWQRNPQRRPSRLPNVFQLKVQVMCWRYYNVKTSAANLDDCAADVMSLIDELVEDGATPYHQEGYWPQLRRQATQMFSHKTLALGVRLAEPALSADSKPTLRDWLRLELAEELFRAGSAREDADVPRVANVLRGWHASPFEKLREMAYQTAKQRRRKFRYQGDPTLGHEWEAEGSGHGDDSSARNGDQTRLFLADI